MNRIILFLKVFLFYSLGPVFAQSSTSSDKQDMTVTASQEAHYPQGEPALYNYVLYNTRYSEEAKKKHAEGAITLSFDVMPDSSVINVKIISDVCCGVGEEVKKLVEKLKFAPAVMMGVKVRTTLMMDFPVKAH